MLPPLANLVKISLASVGGAEVGAWLQLTWHIAHSKCRPIIFLTNRSPPEMFAPWWLFSSQLTFFTISLSLSSFLYLSLSLSLSIFILPLKDPESLPPFPSNHHQFILQLIFWKLQLRVQKCILTLSLSLTHSLSHSHTLSFTSSNIKTHTFTRVHPGKLSITHTHTLSLSHSLPFPPKSDVRIFV